MQTLTFNTDLINGERAKPTNHPPSEIMMPAPPLVTMDYFTLFCTFLAVYIISQYIFGDGSAKVLKEGLNEHETSEYKSAAAYKELAGKPYFHTDRTAEMPPRRGIGRLSLAISSGLDWMRASSSGRSMKPVPKISSTPVADITARC